MNTNFKQKLLTIGAAFGIGALRWDSCASDWRTYQEGRSFCFVFGTDNQRRPCTFISIGQGCEMYDCCVRLSETTWWVKPSKLNARDNEAMARGLYRLGIEDPELLSHLFPLSAHERLELRDSLPFQFWPLAWQSQLQLSQ